MMARLMGKGDKNRFGSDDDEIHHQLFVFGSYLAASLWSVLKHSIGKDLMNISFPVSPRICCSG
jgi:hypothetical protein